MTPRHSESHGVNQLVDRPDLQSLGVRQCAILVADDDALVRNLVTLQLKNDGYFVLAAADGREGLELSRQYHGPIDLVLTDVRMPKLNGTDLRAHLIQERPGIKVLVMSGADMTEIVSQNAKLPFLAKPFDGETLKARVRAILAAPPQPARVNARGVPPSGTAPSDTRAVQMSSRAELARRVLEHLAQGDLVSAHDAFQLRNWAVRPEDSMLTLEEIGQRILDQVQEPARSTAACSDNAAK
jgi:DNA-binding response OmpR family regulator